MTPGNASRTAFGHWGRGILPKRSTSREAGGGDHHVVPRSKDRVKPSVGKEPAWTRRDEEARPRILQAGAVAFYPPCRLVSNAQGTHRTQQPNSLIHHALRSVSLWTLSLCVRPSLWRLSSSPRKRAAGTVGFPASGESFEGASCVVKSRLKSPCLRNNHHHTH